jgi:alpha-tubulin suppressor-like RCC1 family protein
MKDIGWTLTPTLATGLLLITLGCGEEVQSPSNLESPPAFATTATLTFRLVTTGTYHSCGVTTSDVAYCWGDNLHGALGDGTTIDRTRPVAVAGGLRFSVVSAGEYFTCGITLGQKAYCWGLNDNGQLGDATLSNRLRPVAVKGGLVFRQIRPGSQYTCGATTTDKGYCWGSNRYGRLGIASIDARRLVPTPVAGGLAFRRVIAGGSHSCGLTPTGKGYCWGRNAEGQLGIGQTVVRRLAPNAVSGGLSFTQLVPGYFHTCGVTGDKQAYCWGSNGAGQIGDGWTINRLVPTRVAGGHLFKGVSPFAAHTCGVTSEQRIWCWGSNLYGQVGYDPYFTSLRIPVPVGTRLYSAVAGGLAAVHTCGLATSGAAYCWGGNSDGQLGDGTTTNHSTPAPVVSPS